MVAALTWPLAGRVNLVFLSSEGIHQYFLINEVHRRHGVKKVFLQAPVVRRRSLSERLLRLLRPGNARLTVRSVILKVLFRGERKREIEFETQRFFPGGNPHIHPEIPVEYVESFNKRDGVLRVAGEDPDLIVVFGTDILRGAILGVARTAILNIHRDIVPKYRGGGHPFWAFYHGDFENVGATVHVCVDGLDAGDILGQRRYPLSPDDAIHTLRYRTTLTALDILQDVIARFKNGTVEYRKQPADSKVWRARDLTMRKQLLARWRFRRYIRGLNEQRTAARQATPPVL